MTISILVFLNVFLTMWPIKRRVLCSLSLNLGRSLGLSQSVEYVRSVCMCPPRLGSKNNKVSVWLQISITVFFSPSSLFSCHPFLLPSYFPMDAHNWKAAARLWGSPDHLGKLTYRGTEASLRWPVPTCQVSEAPWKWILQPSFPPWAFRWLWHQLTHDWNSWTTKPSHSWFLTHRHCASMNWCFFVLFCFYL